MTPAASTTSVGTAGRQPLPSALKRQPVGFERQLRLDSLAAAAAVGVVRGNIGEARRVGMKLSAESPSVKGALDVLCGLEEEFRCRGADGVEAFTAQAQVHCRRWMPDADPLLHSEVVRFCERRRDLLTTLRDVMRQQPTPSPEITHLPSGRARHNTTPTPLDPTASPVRRSETGSAPHTRGLHPHTSPGGSRGGSAQKRSALASGRAVSDSAHASHHPTASTFRGSGGGFPSTPPLSPTAPPHSYLNASECTVRSRQLLTLWPEGEDTAPSFEALQWSLLDPTVASAAHHRDAAKEVAAGIDSFHGYLHRCGHREPVVGVRAMEHLLVRVAIPSDAPFTAVDAQDFCAVRHLLHAPLSAIDAAASVLSAVGKLSYVLTTARSPAAAVTASAALRQALAVWADVLVGDEAEEAATRAGDMTSLSLAAAPGASPVSLWWPWKAQPPPRISAARSCGCPLFAIVAQFSERLLSRAMVLFSDVFVAPQGPLPWLLRPEASAANDHPLCDVQHRVSGTLSRSASTSALSALTNERDRDEDSSTVSSDYVSDATDGDAGDPQPRGRFIGAIKKFFSFKIGPINEFRPSDGSERERQRQRVLARHDDTSSQASGPPSAGTSLAGWGGSRGLLGTGSDYGGPDIVDASAPFGVLSQGGAALEPDALSVSEGDVASVVCSRRSRLVAALHRHDPELATAMSRALSFVDTSGGRGAPCVFLSITFQREVSGGPRDSHRFPADSLFPKVQPVGQGRRCLTGASVFLDPARCRHCVTDCETASATSTEEYDSASDDGNDGFGDRSVGRESSALSGQEHVIGGLVCSGHRDPAVPSYLAEGDAIHADSLCGRLPVSAREILDAVATAVASIDVSFAAAAFRSRGLGSAAAHLSSGTASTHLTNPSSSVQTPRPPPGALSPMNSFDAGQSPTPSARSAKPKPKPSRFMALLSGLSKQQERPPPGNALPPSASPRLNASAPLATPAALDLSGGPPVMEWDASHAPALRPVAAPGTINRVVFVAGTAVPLAFVSAHRTYRVTETSQRPAQRRSPSLTPAHQPLAWPTPPAFTTIEAHMFNAHAGPVSTPRSGEVSAGVLLYPQPRGCQLLAHVVGRLARRDDDRAAANNGLREMERLSGSSRHRTSAAKTLLEIHADPLPNAVERRHSNSSLASAGPRCPGARTNSGDLSTRKHESPPSARSCTYDVDVDDEPAVVLSPGVTFALVVPEVAKAPFVAESGAPPRREEQNQQVLLGAVVRAWRMEASIEQLCSLLAGRPPRKG